MKKEKSIFGKTTDPREAQKKGAAAKKEKKSRVQAILAKYRNKPLTAEEAELIDRLLLLMTEKELREFIKDDSMPLEMRNRARLLVGIKDKTDAMDAFKVGEAMRDRAFGKPIQKTITETEEETPRSTIEVVFSGYKPGGNGGGNSDTEEMG